MAELVVAGGDRRRARRRGDRGSFAAKTRERTRRGTRRKTAKPRTRPPTQAPRRREPPSAEDPPAAEEGYGRTPEPIAEPQDESPPPKPDAGGARVLASPVARRIAEQRGIDLSTIAGTGPKGRIVRADVEGAAPSDSAATPAPSPEPAPTPAPTPAPAPRSSFRPNARASRAGAGRYSARGRETLQRPQGHCPPAHRIEADRPALLPDDRRAARRAAGLARRAQRLARGGRRQAQRQRHADQGARPRADPRAAMQRQLPGGDAAALLARRHFRRRRRADRAHHSGDPRGRHARGSPPSPPT